MPKHDPRPHTRADFSPDALAERAAQSIRETQAAHLNVIDLLEQGYGLDLDAFIAIHGMEVLDGTIKSSREKIGRWQSLYEALGSGDNYVAVVNTYADRVPGCYGFGAKAKYRPSTHLAIFKDARSVRVISEEDKQGRPRLILRGTGAYHEYPEGDDYAKTSLKKMRPQDIEIAGFNSANGFCDHVGMACHASTLSDLYEALQYRHPYDGYNAFDDRAMNWLLNAVD